ncbi:MAG: type II 3-dehydroquinate dehydratase [Lachnospiraceae bacterium]|nr:type II 3-dehydroquinate dehydratase [Lachnospiraceae bacterium]
MNVLIIHGPNLNMLGYRDKKIYGSMTYEGLKEYISVYAKSKGMNTAFFQSNHEGELIDCIQESCHGDFDAIVINAGAYSHYSYAIRDALEICHFPKVEVHLSNVMQREDFRKTLVLSDVCDRTIYGLGPEGYLLALDFLLDKTHNV